VRSDTEWARCGGKRLVAGPLILYEDEIEYIFDPRKRKRVQAVIQAYSQKVQQSFLVRVDLDQVTGVVLSMSEEPAGVWAGADK
jgi:hypothetical protein